MPQSIPSASRRAPARALPCLLSLLLLAFAAPAVAQESEPTPPPSQEDKVKAKALYEEAVKLYQEGNLEASAQALEQAYQHDPNPVLAYNIGKAYDDAADLNKADSWYRKALESQDLGEEERRKATKALERIEKVRAQLSESESDRAQAEADKDVAEAERQRLEAEKARVERELAEATAGRERHDGFFARLLFGLALGGASTRSSGPAGVEVSVSGAGPHASVAVGWAFWDALVVHVGFFGQTYSDPSVKVAEAEQKTKGTFSANGWGLGATYYFMPINVFLGLQVGGVTVVAAVDDESGGGGVEFKETKTGWGFEACAGKEWWLSDNWGLGAAAALYFAKVPAPEAFSEKFTIFGLGITASLTYN